MMDSVYDQLRHNIVMGVLPPGAPLVETVVAKEIGVSRTPIREAFRRLEQDGLIERANRGLRVRARSAEDILEIYEVRAVLEGTAARLAAQHHSEVDELRMRSCLLRMQENPQSDAQTLALMNAEFHNAIWRASHNRTLVDVLDRLSLHLYRYPFTTYLSPGRAASSLKEHEDLLTAILDHDQERAARIASEHMMIARNIRLEHWAHDSDGLMV